jgi:hypothetical protein
LPFCHSFSEFCCKSHATSWQNKFTPSVISKEGKERIAAGNRERAKLKPKSKTSIQNDLKKQTSIISGPCSPVYFLTCKHCYKIFTTRKKLKYCKCCTYLYSNHNRNRFKFTFGISKYPELFNMEQIKLLGFYAPGGKSGNWNPNGLSRDHKVSVNEAIKNNYDPYYITHPCNCELMPQTQNNKKKAHSSITYEELIILVEEYETKVAPLVRLERTIAFAED